jgi:DNA-binding MarR family transcriptional regulator
LPRHSSPLRAGSSYYDVAARSRGYLVRRHEFDQSDFQHLLELRTGLRRFLRWSERQAQAVGLTPAKHQLLLAIKGHPNPAGPTVGEIADYLVLKHHSAVELVDRAAKDGIVRRKPDRSNKSIVRVKLTPAGNTKLEKLAEAHLQELVHLAPTMRALWKALESTDGENPHPASRSPSPRPAPS